MAVTCDEDKNPHRGSAGVSGRSWGQGPRSTRGRIALHMGLREPFASLVERGAGETELVLPSEIPWSTLKARDLEETVYWLLDALGAKDLEWRRGGRGVGAADQGRDLQATFQVQTLDGSFEAQRWWVEAKGRARTVERAAVQRAVSDAEVQKDVDVLAIVTNGDFTNPLRDWVADWNGARRRPALKLWDREALEKMLSRQPGVVLRLFSQALSPQGRLAAVRERFWNRTEFASSADLARLWRDRVKLKYCEVDLLVLIGSEYANGDPASRRWSEVFAEEDLLKFTCLALRNVLVVAGHAASVGAPHESIVRAVGHSLVVCVRDFGAEATFAAIEDTLRYSDGKKFTVEHFDVIVGAVCQRMMREFLRPCADDCDRVVVVDRENRPGRQFWERYRSGANSDDGAAAEELSVAFQPRFPCNVGLPTDSGIACPLWSKPPNVRDALRILERVIRVRSGLQT